MESCLCEMEEKLKEYIINHETFFRNINSSSGGVVESSKDILVHNTEINEQEFGLETFYKTDFGWFLKRNGTGKHWLTFAAMSMNLVHSVYHEDQCELDKYLSFMEQSTDEKLKLACSFYAKQKIATIRTLECARKIHDVVLYRGIHDVDLTAKNYYHQPLESFTANRAIASYYAGSGGFIIKKTYPINKIFAYKKVLFRTSKTPNTNIRKSISRAKEYIVENDCPFLPLIDGENKFFV